MIESRCAICQQPIASLLMSANSGGGVRYVVPGHNGAGPLIGRKVGSGRYIAGQESRRDQPGFTRLLPHAAVCERGAAA